MGLGRGALTPRPASGVPVGPGRIASLYSPGMRFWKSIPGALLLVAILASLVVGGGVAAQVHRVTHPTRRTDMPLNLGASLAKAEEVTFNASDGIVLHGWLFKGDPRQGPIVLAHDLGESHTALMSLAVVLNHAGFTVLTFDFRGHGASEGTGSTLGINESRDVLGAVDFVAALPPEIADGRKVGVYGCGMGAQAAVLAAAERASMRAIVLDGLWPDAEWILVRRVFEDWPWGVKHLGALPAGAFTMMTGTSPSRERAAEVLPSLGSRDVLLVAPAGNVRLEEAMKAMYDEMPERRDAERGLLTLPATQTSGLAADDLARYQERVVEFFRVRLARG